MTSDTRWTQGMKLGDFRNSCRNDRTHGPCVHPYSPANASLARAPGGLHLRYQCPHCHEVITGAEWPLRKVMNR